MFPLLKMARYLHNLKTLQNLWLLKLLRVVDFMNPAGMRSVGGNLFAATPESGIPIEMTPQDGLRIKQGFLESSNVDVAEELVSMIVAQSF